MDRTDELVLECVEGSSSRSCTMVTTAGMVVLKASGMAHVLMREWTLSLSVGNEEASGTDEHQNVCVHDAVGA